MINTSNQTLTFNDKSYAISTAKNGLGELDNSFCTPRGEHKIYEKIGTKMPINTQFVARKPTTIYTGEATNKDLILSRILWLDGLEDFNSNSKQRHIYIHGTNDEKNIGVPCSLGCIRMLNNDIIALFNLVKINDLVMIK